MSPTAPSRLTVDATLDKDEGISDEEDPAELRVLLDLNEQEASQLRRKVEELETSHEASKKQIKELQEKCKTTGNSAKDKLSSVLKTAAGANGNSDKIKQKDKEISELKIKLNEKERALDKLKLEVKGKTGKSGDTIGDLQGGVNHKRQLELVEQEAAVLRAKVSTLELEIDGVSTENKKLTVQVARLARKDSTGGLEKDTKNVVISAELIKTKESLTKLEKENGELQRKLKTVLEFDVDKLPARMPKKFSDMTTKMQLQKMVGDLEEEVKEMRAIVARSGVSDLKKLEVDKGSALQEVMELREQINTANAEISELFFSGLN